MIHNISRFIAALAIILLTAQTAWADGISYLDATGTQQSCTTYTTVESSSTSWNSGWYVVSSSTTIADRITVSGTVNLILCDGATLTASKGITVGSSATFNIYAQTNDEATMGALVADGTNDKPNRYAGIGGVENAAAGMITINGGKINATGWCAAGIGSGGGTSTVGTITINGGIVTAQDNAHYGAGIGGGFSGGKAGTINLNGGVINAAGIGSGYFGGNCSITVNISDGVKKIVATPVQGGACIGKGKSASGSVTVNFISGGNIVTGDAKDAVFYDTGEGSQRQVRAKAMNHAVTMSDDLKANITLNTEYAFTGETVTLTLGTAVDATTLSVNDGAVATTDAGNRQYTFTMPDGDVTVTATLLQTYAVSLPANMEVVSATNAADADGKYITGTTVTFMASFPYAASNVSYGTSTLEPDANGIYTVTVADADVTVTATVERSATIDLSDAPGDFNAIEGDVLTGTTSHTVTIADGAGITLSGATITGGIVCEGSATITLVGTNSVSVVPFDKAGIQIGGSGTTLTIRGDGSLTATGGSQAAGIGLGRTWDASVTAGVIVIEGGTVNASGDIGIGIGTVGNSQTATIDGISIKGGTVSASLGKGYIYNGCTATVGYIKIYDTIDMVDASKITESVTYMHDDTDVTASASDYFTIIENGDRRIIVPKDDNDYTITIADGIEHGTLTVAETAKYMETVTVTATPAFGYRFVRLIVKDAQNNDVASTGNTFLMPKGGATVSAVFEQGTHGTTEFVWGYFGPSGFVNEATIYDGVTTVNIQTTGQSYSILKYDEYTYSKYLLDNDTYEADIPYAGGTGEFYGAGNGTNFAFDYDGKTGYYDITMTDVGNGKWSVSILKTVGQMDVVPDQTYTGSAITPEPTVVAGSLTLTKGTDYTYSYTNNTNVGTATVTVTFQGDYESLGSVEKEFTIVWSETDTDEYTIHNAAEWNVFCDCLNDNDTYNRFSGKTVRLGDDITVTRMAGGSNHAFTGTFDGGGHTLTLAYGTADAPIDAQFVAPFLETAADGEHQPTFRNLTIAGTIYDGYTGSEAHNIGGLIGHLFGTVTIEQCTSNVSINATGGAGGFVGLCEHSVSFTDCHSSAVITSPGGNNSGFVAWSRSSAWEINFTGCLFDGKLLQQNGSGSLNGGFIGWKGDAKTVNITNCLCAPAPLADGETMASSNSATFSREHANYAATIQNCYYTRALGTAQGKATRTVAAATDVTIEAVALTGTATQYTVSGITAYSGGGLQRGETLYYGSGDQLSLTLSNSATAAPRGYQYAYTASAGTLSGSTLTMPDEDVTISVNTADLAPIDWATVNQGNSADPYMIYNKDQLLLLAHRVNGTNGETANTYQGKYFKLGADITFDHDADEGDFYDENYEAIGMYDGTDRYFKGKFNGDGHTVSGIRINKTGSDYQGLFGCISSGADIHDVHLTDARITGCECVGGIAGYNYGGYIMRCSVTDSYITATSNANYGTICGSTTSTDRLRNNYYHGCTVNDTPVTSGVGCREADITANNGALPAYRLDLGANITTPPGTFVGDGESFATPPVGARLAPENGFTLAGNHYFASGYVFTPGSTLASGAAQGYTPRATLGDVLLDLYTPTGDTDLLAGKAIARLTITADCDGKTLDAAIRSDGLQHDVSYMTADGTAQTAQAVALDGTEKNLAAGWYFVGQPTVAFDHTLNLDGDVNLILVDGNTMKVRTTKTRDGISAEGHSLHIYGQTEGTGALNAQTKGKLVVVIRITNGTLGIHGGNVKAYAESTVNTKSAIHVERATAGDALVIDRGTLTANSKNSCGIYIEGGDVRINGGQVTATGAESGIDISDNEDVDDESLSIPGILTLSGGTLTASSFYTSSGESWAGTLAIAPGLTYTDGTSLYDSTTETATLAALAGKTLQPCLVLADAADNTAAITDHAGQTLAVALSDRTLYKDGSWNTLCLPFAVDLTASGTLSGDNVQAMTLNTTSSNLADGTLTLNFTAATTIPAGTPFIIKWDKSGTDITNPVFEDVTIDAEKHDATVAGVLTFTGTYAPVSIDSEGDNTMLYLGAANKLYYPTKSMTIGTHRAYFQLLGDLTAGEPTSPQSSHVRAFVLNFGDDEATGIISVHDSGFTLNASAAWYTLDGRRLDGQPTAKGLYIHGGKKVIVK